MSNDQDSKEGKSKVDTAFPRAPTEEISLVDIDVDFDIDFDEPNEPTMQTRMYQIAVETPI